MEQTVADHILSTVKICQPDFPFDTLVQLVSHRDAATKKAEVTIKRFTEVAKSAVQEEEEEEEDDEDFDIDDSNMDV